MIDNENRLVSRVEEVFNVWDYVLFGIMLAASCIIGIFLAWKDSKEESKQTTKDYLLGKFKPSGPYLTWSSTLTNHWSLTLDFDHLIGYKLFLAS